MNIPRLGSFKSPPGKLLGGVNVTAEPDSGYSITISGEGIRSDLLDATGIPRGRLYYLPAARFGILQIWPFFASMALHTSRRGAGLERVELPAVAGVTADFLQVLWGEVFARAPRGEEPATLRPALKIIEREMFLGGVFADTGRPDRASLVYRSQTGELPLQRASSMVGELAPLDMWIRHLLSPGDLLVIDEPEAHLHPENQRRVARVLVRLARAGVQVLCPTHSPLILHQISNHLLASEADPQTREQLGFTEHDILRPEDVAVYLFSMRDDGTHVEPVSIERGFGISEEEFVRVSEAIGRETYDLMMQTARSGDGNP